MKNPKENGLSSNEEFEILRKIEDKLNIQLCDKDAAINIARITCNSKRVFVYYSTTSCSEKVKESFEGFQSYKYELHEENDEQWEFYKDVLYPSEEEHQWIKDRSVVAQLERLGDPLSIKRDVHHWIYFKNIEDREKFKIEISKEGYSLVERNNELDVDEGSFGLHIVRDDKVDLESINEVTISLLRKAKNFGAKYDGWEARVKKKALV